MSVPAGASVSTRMAALLADARARARTSGSPVLASLAERALAVDPLDALEAMAREAGCGRPGDATDRMYWRRPGKDFAVAGFGSVAVLRDQGARRFRTIDAEWQELRAGAVIADPSGGVAGVGPMLMGGFAFEPDGPHTERWRDFPAAHLFLPRAQLVAADGEHWLTLNLIVSPDGKPDMGEDELLALRACAIGALATGPAPREAPVIETLASTDALPRRAWDSSVQAIVAAIRVGALEKAVLAREVRITAPRDFDITATLRQLRSAHEASYVFGCWHGGSAFVGATPELLVGVEGREVHASSLAGSVARGATAEDDAAHAAELLASAKDRVEHEVVRRALCAGLAELCDDVAADEEPSLLSLPQVHHLYTDVRGQLREGHTLLELVATLHPTPAVGGEPREAALRLIRELEGVDRGWYAAPIGWMQRDRGEFAVALRSALISGNGAVLFAGCGIVADSDPDEEFAESLLKLRPMEMALALSVGASDAPPSMRAVAGGGAGR